jgi:hypothetical protein
VISFTINDKDNPSRRSILNYPRPRAGAPRYAGTPRSLVKVLLSGNRTPGRRVLGSARRAQIVTKNGVPAASSPRSAVLPAQHASGHLRTVTLEKSAATFATSVGASEYRPANAIASIPIARTKPKTAFALTHPFGADC